MTQIIEASHRVEEGWISCDQCPARAACGVDLPHGYLAFCQHHYNKNAEALTNQGGVARILDIYDKEMGSVCS
jgi:hypothetical protein